MPPRHGSGARVLLTPRCPWWNPQRVKAEEHIAELESRSAPSSSVAAAEPRRSVATAESRPNPRRRGKPRGTRDPNTVALKKARRYARRHKTLDPTTPEELREQQLAALGHPDLARPGTPRTETPPESPSSNEGGEAQQSVEVTGHSSSVVWPLRAKPEVKLEEEKKEVKLEEKKDPQRPRAVLKRRAPSSETKWPVSPSRSPAPKFWGRPGKRPRRAPTESSPETSDPSILRPSWQAKRPKAQAKRTAAAKPFRWSVIPRGSVVGCLKPKDGGGNSSSRGSNTAAGSAEPKHRSPEPKRRKPKRKRKIKDSR